MLIYKKIYKVKCMLCETICIFNTQQKPNKGINAHSYDVQSILKNRKNQTPLIYITGNTLILLCHTMICTVLLYLK